MTSRRVLMVTTTRADYGLWRPVWRALAARGDVDARFLVSGTHLDQRHGETVAALRREGAPVWAEIPCLDPGDEPDLAALRATGRVALGLADAWRRAAWRPDLALVLGDRFEMLAIALGLSLLGVPLGHLYGGERTEGALDESYRHALTKLSHLHFVATASYGRRVAQLGEEAWRIHVTGAPGLDAIEAARSRGLPRLDEVDGLALGDAFVLVTYHPETLSREATERGAEALLAALESPVAVELPVIFTAPNADPGGDALRARFRAWCDARPARARFIASLGVPRYYQALNQAAVMLGNSSSGILEAPSFGLPVVNIGDRQRGRVRAANVLDVPPDFGDVRGALERALAPGFRASLAGMRNPYGDGRAAPRVAQVVAETPLDGRLLAKRFEDLPDLRLGGTP